MATQDDWHRITLRIPSELHEKLKEAATLSSVNAEIITRLEASFRSEAEIALPYVQIAIDRTIEKMLDKLAKDGLGTPSSDETKLSDLEKVFKDKGVK